MTNHKNGSFSWLCDITFDIQSKFHWNPSLSEGYLAYLLITAITVAITNFHWTAVHLLGWMQYGLVWRGAPSSAASASTFQPQHPRSPRRHILPFQVMGIITYFDIDKPIYKICLNTGFLDRNGRYLDIHGNTFYFFCGRLLWWVFTAEPFATQVWGNTLWGWDSNPLPVTCVSHILSSWLSIL